jgi:formate/nitrite transporter FocA (FNT family)
VSSVLGFHHSIVGNIEVLELLHTNTITIDYLVFLSLAIVGNAIGGASSGTFQV